MWTPILLLVLFQAAPARAGADAQAPATPAAAEPALRIDGAPVEARSFREWLVRRHGETYAARYAMHVGLLEAARANAEPLPPIASVEGALESEIGTRVRGAFGGDIKAWERELAASGRTPAGYRAQRRLDLWDDALARHAARAGLPAGSEPTLQQISELRERVGAPSVDALPALAAPAPAEAAAAAAEPVLKFGERALARGEYGQWLLHFAGEQHLREFASARVLEREAREAKLAIAPGEIDARVEQQIEAHVKNEFRGDRARFERAIEREYRDLDAYRRELARRLETELLAEKLLLAQRHFGESELRAEWEARYGPGGAGAVMRCVHLYLPAPPIDGPAPTPEEALARRKRDQDALSARAQKLAADVRAGLDFERWIREQAEDPAERASGGLLPLHVKLEAFPPESRRVLEALEPGQISDPLVAPGGFALYQLVRRETVSFASVEPQLREEFATRRPSLADIAAMRRSLESKVAIECPPELFR